MLWLWRIGLGLLTLAVAFVAMAWHTVESEYQSKRDPLVWQGQPANKLPAFSWRNYFDSDALSNRAVTYYALALASLVPALVCLMLAWKRIVPMQTVQIAKEAGTRRRPWIWRLLTTEIAPREFDESLQSIGWLFGIFTVIFSLVFWMHAFWSFALSLTVLSTSFFVQWRRHHWQKRSRTSESVETRESPDSAIHTSEAAS